MPKKTNSWPFAVRALILALFALAVQTAHAHPSIKRWAFEGSILEISDEGKLCGPLEVGDPVYGTLSFDVTWDFLEENEWGVGEFETIYDQPEAFPLITLTTENLATETARTYEPYLSGYTAPWDNITDWSGPGAVEDLLLFEQDFYAPGTMDWTGFTSQLQFLAARSKFAPPPRLPTELNLDDWIAATLTLAKLSGPFAYDAVITAEIHTLTPIDVPFIAGDFTGDAVVDARDLAVWKYVAPSMDANLSSDANADGVVDGGDFLEWQRELTAPPLDRKPAVAVPEPAAVILALLAAASPLAGCRRRSKPRPCRNDV